MVSLALEKHGACPVSCSKTCELMPAKGEEEHCSEPSVFTGESWAVEGACLRRLGEAVAGGTNGAVDDELVDSNFTHWVVLLLLVHLRLRGATEAAAHFLALAVASQNAQEHEHPKRTISTSRRSCGPR